MGTTCDINIYDGIFDGDGIVTIHKNYDGYLNETGLKLCEYLINKTVVSGHHNGENEFNGPYCAAASLVKFLKNGVGDVYLYPFNDNSPQPATNFTYNIYIESFKPIKMNIFETDKLIVHTQSISKVYKNILKITSDIDLNE